MCSIHRCVSGSSGLSALVTVGCVLAAGCASGHRVSGVANGSSRPVIANQAEILQALGHEYRVTGLMEQGVADTTVVELLVDTRGEVGDARVGVSSGNETVDQAALRVARIHRFGPARNRGRAVPVWVSRSISFVPGLCDTEPMVRGIMLPPNPAGFRGLRNEATVALLVDREGLVREAKIETGSGSPDYDRTVLGEVRKWRYRPGTLGCEPAEKWTTVKFGPSGRMVGKRREVHARILRDTGREVGAP